MLSASTARTTAALRQQQRQRRYRKPTPLHIWRRRRKSGLRKRCGNRPSRRSGSPISTVPTLPRRSSGCAPTRKPRIPASKRLRQLTRIGKRVFGSSPSVTVADRMGGLPPPCTAGRFGNRNCGVKPKIISHPLSLARQLPLCECGPFAKGRVSIKCPAFTRRRYCPSRPTARPFRALRPSGAVRSRRCRGSG